MISEMRLKLTCLFLLVSLSSAIDPVEDSDEGLIIKTSSGLVKGGLELSVDKKKVQHFLGIPYAKPPIGKLRYSPPVPPDHWEGTHDATKFGHPCLQFDDSSDNGHPRVKEGSNENCLFLNVWTPHPRPENAPVLVYIHGGMHFNAGAGSDLLYNGGHLAIEQEIVVVNINYRLGELGFLFLGVNEAPGNVGLMDQALALKWVNDNIAHFGGNPNKITLEGQMSGSTSIGLHMLIPSSQSLFQQALMYDLVPIAPEVVRKQTDALHISRQLVKQVGCASSVNDPFKELSCLREKSAVDLMNVEIKTNSNKVEFFSPVVDGNYIPDDPLILLKQGRIKRDIKVLLVTSHHRAYKYVYKNGFAAIGLKPEEHHNIEKSDFKRLINIILDKPNHLVTNELLRIYTDWTDPNNLQAIRNQAVEFANDYFCVCPAIQMANELTLHGVDVYQTQVDEHISRGDLPYWTGFMEDDHVIIMFGNTHPGNNYTENDHMFSHKVMDIVGNFFRKGIPKTGDQIFYPRYNLRYKPYTHNIERTIRTGHFLRAEQCSFWNDVYPLIQRLSGLLNEGEHQ